MSCSRPAKEYGGAKKSGQCSVVFDTEKQMSFYSLQEDIQHYFETHLQGLQNQARNHLWKSESLQKVDAKVINVEESSLDCGLCESDKFCNFSRDHHSVKNALSALLVFPQCLSVPQIWIRFVR